VIDLTLENFFKNTNFIWQWPMGIKAKIYSKLLLWQHLICKMMAVLYVTLMN